MSTEPTTARESDGLDPFLLPSPTVHRFALLVALVAALACILFVMMHNTLPSVWERRMEHFERCNVIPNPLRDNGQPDVDAGSMLRELCMVPVDRAQGVFMLGGLALLFAVAFGLYWTAPARRLRREKLEPISAEDAPEVLAVLDQLVALAELPHKPRFVWSPTNPAVSGLAFGRRGQYIVALTGGLVALHYTDATAFRAIVLHELAHLRNRDVDVTYLTVATFDAFMIVVIVPFVVSRFFVPPDHLLGFAWRLLAASMLVWLTRNEVLRTREHYADLRAHGWDGANGALPRIFDSQRPRATGSPALMARARALLDFHPSPEQRRKILDDCSALFRPDLVLAVATGATATIGIRGGSVLFNNFIVVSLTGWLERLDPGTLIVCGIVGTLCAYVIGSDLWESELLAALRSRGAHGGWRMGLALGIGMVLGFWIDVTSAVTSALGQSMLGVLCWLLAAVGVSVIATKGFADGVHAWLVLGGRRELLARARSVSIATYAVLLVLWLTALSFAQVALMASEQSMSATIDRLGAADEVGAFRPFVPVLLTAFTLVTGLVPTLTMTVLGLIPFFVLFGLAKPEGALVASTGPLGASAIRPLRALMVGVAAGLLPILLGLVQGGTAGVVTMIGATGLSVSLVLSAVATAAFVARKAPLLGWLHGVTCGLGAGAVTWCAITLLASAVGADVQGYYQVATGFNVVAWLALGAGLATAARSRMPRSSQLGRAR